MLFCWYDVLSCFAALSLSPPYIIKSLVGKERVSWVSSEQWAPRTHQLFFILQFSRITAYYKVVYRKVIAFLCLNRNGVLLPPHYLQPDQHHNICIHKYKLSLTNDCVSQQLTCHKKSFCVIHESHKKKYDSLPRLLFYPLLLLLWVARKVGLLTLYTTKTPPPLVI